MEKPKKYTCSKCGKPIQNSRALQIHEMSCKAQTQNSNVKEMGDDVTDLKYPPQEDYQKPEEETQEEPEELSLEDLGFAPNVESGDLACDSCGAKVTGNETHCPNCMEAFE